MKGGIEDLAEMYGVMIILRLFEDVKLEEIGEIVDENEKRIKRRLYKVVRVLKVEL
ncbi:hypothetical protein [Bacillus sp. WP8]|uniref:hypothetical protein n=1 Tax=Bacillus sp. WP8 TaxID=756828 RepID=UPI001642A66B|nr:hypothetical protein [Bacillus sp. WP8]